MDANTERLNARLKAHDGLLAASDLSPTEQMSVAILLAVLACRRVFAKHGIADGRSRKAVRAAAEKEFATKLRTYTMPPIAPEPGAPGDPVTPADTEYAEAFHAEGV